MKVLVAYLSRSGNTQKVAEAMYQEIQADKEIKQLSEVGGLDGYDLSFIGLPIEKFGPASEAQEFLAAHSASKRIVLFVTHAAPEEDDVVPGYLTKVKEAAAKADIVGVFSCQGELAQPVKMAMLNSGVPDLRAWAEMSECSLGQPDAARLERARAFARQVMVENG